jgi:hypothetical protein
MSDEPKRWRGHCFGGGCAFGYCAVSKSLIELLLDIVEHSEVETTIGNLVKAGTGCYLCDRISKLPMTQRKRKLQEEDVTARDRNLTRIQQEKAAAETTK